MNCSMPCLPVPHCLPEFSQIHVHWIGDAIQPSHSLLSSSPLAFGKVALCCIKVIVRDRFQAHEYHLMSLYHRASRFMILQDFNGHFLKYTHRIKISCFQDRPLSIVAAAKLLQSCPTLCDPIDGSPPGSPVRGILLARTLEWVAISFSNTWKWKVKVKLLSCVRLRDLTHCSLPGSSIHGIFQARVLEWVAVAFSENTQTTTQLHSSHMLAK